LGRLRVLSGDEVCRILAAHGFVEVRRRSSHVVMQRVTDDGATTVPVPDHREVKIGTLRAIIRQ
jgi:predicted RNA binding protein YcfA (HicA-like mRNA interferase family)